MIYLIGDIQGCCDALERLLQTIDFSPSRDHLYALGDLVNRGPDSLGTLRRMQGLGASATCLLGNHDWHLIAAALGARGPHRKDTLHHVLQAPDKVALIDWLRNQRMAVFAHDWLMVHAGVVPQWDLATTLQQAQALENLLQGPELNDFVNGMYNDLPDLWSLGLTGHEKLRFALNTLTRVRFVHLDGRLELQSKAAASQSPVGCTPWFEAPDRLTKDVCIAFGHWSTLGLLNRPRLMGIDTGCVWGAKLTAVRISQGQREFIQVECRTAQTPG